MFFPNIVALRKSENRSKKGKTFIDPLEQNVMMVTK
jgi:hypothetical protein